MGCGTSNARVTPILQKDKAEASASERKHAGAVSRSSSSAKASASASASVGHPVSGPASRSASGRSTPAEPGAAPGGPGAAAARGSSAAALSHTQPPAAPVVESPEAPDAVVIDPAPLATVSKAVSLRGLRRLRDRVRAFFGPEAYPSVSTTQVTMEWVKSVTAGHKCRVAEMRELVAREDVGPPAYFISHAWGNSFELLVSSVEAFLAAAGEGTRVWVDIFAVNQHPDGGPYQAADVGAFKDVVRAATAGTLVVMGDVAKSNPPPSRQLVLLIDGLDEADPPPPTATTTTTTATATITAAASPAILARLPPPVRFVLTTRPGAAGGQVLPCLRRALGGAAQGATHAAAAQIARPEAPKRPHWSEAAPGEVDWAGMEWDDMTRGLLGDREGVNEAAPDGDSDGEREQGKAEGEGEGEDAAGGQQSAAASRGRAQQQQKQQPGQRQEAGSKIEGSRPKLVELSPAQLRSPPPPAAAPTSGGSGSGGGGGGGGGGSLTARSVARACAQLGLLRPGETPAAAAAAGAAAVDDLYGRIFAAAFSSYSPAQAAAVRALLAVLVAAREPLSQSLLEEMGLGPALPLLPGTSAGLFVAVEHRLHPMDGSLLEFLADDGAAAAAAGRRQPYADAVAGHWALAAHLVRHLSPAPSRYSLAYLPHHIAVAAAAAAGVASDSGSSGGGGGGGRAAGGLTLSTAQSALDAMLRDLDWLAAACAGGLGGGLVVALAALPAAAHTPLSADVLRWLRSHLYDMENAAKGGMEGREVVMTSALHRAPLRSALYGMAAEARGAAGWRSEVVLPWRPPHSDWQHIEMIFPSWEVKLYDVAALTAAGGAGVEGRNLASSDEAFVGLAYSPDGLRLMCGVETYWRSMWMVVDAASGKVLTRAARPTGHKASNKLACLAWRCTHQAPAAGSPGAAASGAVGGSSSSSSSSSAVGGGGGGGEGDGRAPGKAASASSSSAAAAGGWVAGGFPDGGVRVWDDATGRQLAALHAAVQGPVRCLALSPDGRRLAVGTHSRAVLLWDMEAAVAQARAHVEEDDARAAAAAAASAAASAAAREGGANKSEESHDDDKESDEDDDDDDDYDDDYYGIFYGCEDSSDEGEESGDAGDATAAAAKAQAAAAKKAQAAAKRAKAAEAMKAKAAAAKRAQDAAFLAKQTAAAAACLTDRNWVAPAGGVDMSWSPATAGGSSTHSGGLLAVCYFRQVTSAMDDGRTSCVELWDPRSGAHVDSLPVATWAYTAVAWGPQGRLLATGSNWNKEGVTLWAPRGWAPGEGQRERAEEAWPAPTSPGGLVAWALPPPPALAAQSYGRVYGLGWGHARSGGAQLAAVSCDTKGALVATWDVEAMRPGAVLGAAQGEGQGGQPPMMFVPAIAWQPGGGGGGGTDGEAGSLLAAPSGSEDSEYGGRVWLLDPRVGGIASSLRTASQAPLLCVSWSPDGGTLAAGGEEGVTWLWDVRKGAEPVRGLEGHTEAISALGWMPAAAVAAAAGGGGGGGGGGEGSVLLSAGEDKRLMLWDVAGGERAGGERLCSPMFEHLTPLQSLAWSPDGERFASGSTDGMVRVWGRGAATAGGGGAVRAGGK
ncbi:hypothetical protein GPECTOR_2g1274 [Gonium pectorale]|uniref:Anaphase-promoting complex subunit 4 WD40 domain-containing protein n=1 Tax=Gonium pectorale TaxID=33097 RepID=A0A150H110_GONPE|nr:hypothetical protein GPECTOR_2g1274 [Gonium pectorale]|eukprot:KXZ55724.1 hypothetical protein GPECTOR_2g1274 [Gonium pectorale]